MDRTPGQSLAMAEAAARRSFRALEALAMSDVADEIFCLVHRNWVAAERGARALREDLPEALTPEDER